MTPLRVPISLIILLMVVSHRAGMKAIEGLTTAETATIMIRVRIGSQDTAAKRGGANVRMDMRWDWTYLEQWIEDCYWEQMSEFDYILEYRAWDMPKLTKLMSRRLVWE